MTDHNVSTVIPSSVFWGPFGNGGIVNGYTKEGWEEIRTQFENNFSEDLELGAQLSIWHRGEEVVNLWGKSSKQKHYDQNTIQNIWSSGKNLEAVCIAKLVDNGFLKYEDLVSKHWPAYGKYGKETTTIADVLRHDAGLPFFSDNADQSNMNMDVKLTNEIVHNRNDLEKVIENAPRFEGRYYHAITRGFIVSGIISRVDPHKRSLSQFMRDEICIPLGITNLFCGITIEEQKKIEFADVVMMSHLYYGIFHVLPSLLGDGKVAADLNFLDGVMWKRSMSE
jgi:CubicO group peptidase (beta-lactamase class C family)